MRKRIGILTGGGDCPGLNAVIRAVTKTLCAEGYDVIGFADGYAGLVENVTIPLDTFMVANILTLGGTILGTSNVANPFRWPGRRGKFTDASKRALSVYRKNRLDGLVIAGGDGTMRIAARLSDLGLNIVGVPKTIDNDLAGTDQTFGFETAVSTATDAIDKVHTTAQSHDRVMVVEVMGRYAGWIALYAGIASGGDIILIPEIPFEYKYVFKKIRERCDAGKSFSIVVAAEGAKPLGGERSVSRRVRASTDPIRLGGIGAKVAAQIEDKMGIESRAIILGHVQRGGSPVPFDRLLATQYGVEAARFCLRGEYGRLVSLRGNRIGSVDLKEAAGEPRLVPLDHPLIRSAKSVGTGFGTKEL